MFKKIFSLTMSLVFVLSLSGLSFAQNTATVTQNSSDNEVYVWQYQVVGGDLTIFITQTAGTFNIADARQKGRQNLTTTIWQWATGSNTSITEQGTPSHPSDYAYDLNINVHQTANGGDNYANIIQKYTAYKMRWNDFRVKQVAGTYNWARMTGETDHSAISSHKLAVDQQAFGFNIADLYVDYYSNEVVRADATGTPEAFPNPATQTTSGGNNELYVDQYGYYGHNTVGLYQSAAGDNYADIDQFGLNNSLGIHQVATSGRNDLFAYQGGAGTAKIVQEAATDNDADILQDGGIDTLVGADSNGAINVANPATQISASAYNLLWTDQSGGNNEIGLYQSAGDYNDAEIYQYDGNNSLGVYQYAPNGHNWLDVTQNGDGVVQVSQTSTDGYNYLYIFQSFGSEAIVFQTATAGNNIATIIQN